MLFLLSCAAAAQGRAVSCPIIAGGGAIRVRDYEVVFSAANERTESTLRGLVIVRASADVRSRHPSGSAAERWAVARPRHPGSGANVGPVMIVHDSSTNTVWIDDSLAVPLAENNNVLLGTIDTRGTFTAVGQARIEPRLPLPTGPCTDASAMKQYQETADTLWARFQASPQIRAFVSP